MSICIQKIKSAALVIYNILSPTWCVECGKPISRSDRHVCRECFDRIKYVKSGCPVCSGELDEKGDCEICSTRQIYFDKNVIAAEYEGVMKSLITGYKFVPKKRIAKVIADIVFPHASQLAGKVDCITAVPASKKKKWKRGFNQAEEVAKEIAKRIGLPYIQFLRETPQSKKQKSLGFTDRFFNVLDRYHIEDKAKPAGRSVLMFDDVFTTGATINECARVLKAAGVLHVFVVISARVNIKKS